MPPAAVVVVQRRQALAGAGVDPHDLAGQVGEVERPDGMGEVGGAGREGPTALDSAAATVATTAAATATSDDARGSR